MAIEFYNRNWRVPSSWNGTEDNNNKVSNYSMSFDGSSEYIDVGLIDITSSKTLSIWFKSSNISSNQGLFEIMPDPNTSDFLIVWIYNSKILVSSNGVASDSKESSVLSSNTWYNLIITKSSGVIDNIYINGLNDTQSTSSTLGFVGGRGNAYIGATYQGTAYANEFNGQIDQVAIFDYSLSASQVTELYGSSSTGVGNPMAITNGRKPVAYYPLGDYSAYNGTEYLVANSALSDFVFDFDNSYTNYISVLNNSSINFGTNDHIISSWINVESLPTSSAQYRTIFSKRSASTTDYQLSIGQNGVIYSYNGSAICQTSTGVIFVGDWFNVVLRCESNIIQIYVNGVNQTLTGTTTTGSANTEPLIIGNRGSNPNVNEGFLGKISNVSIFNTALPPTGTESVASLYNYGTPPDISSYSGLQGWWKLDAGSTFDGSNWTVPDESSNSNNGTSSGMTAANLVQSNLNILSPYSRYALNFDGANDYIDLGDDDAFSFGNGSTDSAFSISAWCYIDSLSNFIVFTKGVYSSTGEWHMRMTGANQMHLVLYDGIDFEACIINETLNTNQWYHFAFTYDGRGGSTANDGILGYLNGSLATLNRVDSGSYVAMTNSSAPLYIAKNGSNYSNGSISNPSIWNAALTTAQVTEIYNEGKPSNLNNHSAYSNLVSWWTLGENSSFNSNWTVLNEISTGPNGVSVNMAEDDLVSGVGQTASGVSSGMGGADNIVGDAPQNSTGNSLSYGMGVDAKSTDVPS